MSQQVKVERDIQFIGDAKHSQNVEGPFHEKMVHFHDHFTDDTLSSDKWLATVTNATIAVDHATYSGGCALVTTDATNNETNFLSTPLCWQDDYNCICEAKILLTDVSGVVLFFGFSDATSEATPNMAIDYAGGVLAAAATNAVGIVCDAGDTVNGVSSIVGVGVNAGTLETAIDSGTDWADGEWHTLRVELDPDGDAYFYLDDTVFGYMSTAIASATRLCITYQSGNRDAAIDTIYIDRIDGWQDEVS